MCAAFTDVVVVGTVIAVVVDSGSVSAVVVVPLLLVEGVLSGLSELLLLLLSLSPITPSCEHFRLFACCCASALLLSLIFFVFSCRKLLLLVFYVARHSSTIVKITSNKMYGPCESERGRVLEGKARNRKKWCQLRKCVWKYTLRFGRACEGQ